MGLRLDDVSGLRKINGAAKTNNVLVIFINQIRMKNRSYVVVQKLQQVVMLLNFMLLLEWTLEELVL